jgi:hypothetical protein
LSMTASELIDKLRNELLLEGVTDASTPEGKPLQGEALGFELGYRRGWNARAREIIAELSGEVLQ